MIRLLPSGHSNDYYIKVYGDVSEEEVSKIDEYLKRLEIMHNIKNSKVDGATIYLYVEDPYIVDEVRDFIQQIKSDKRDSSISIHNLILHSIILLVAPEDMTIGEFMLIYGPGNPDFELINKILTDSRNDILFKNDRVIVFRHHAAFGVDVLRLYDIDLNDLSVFKVVVIDPMSGLTKVFPRNDTKRSSL